MSERRRVLLLVGIMFGITMVVLIAGLLFGYYSTIETQRSQLIESAQSQARLIESILDYQRSELGEGVPESLSAVRQIVENAHERYGGFGETGEFVLARKQGPFIVFILRHRGEGVDYPVPVPFDSEYAEPMRRALMGESGTMIGLDYEGTRVLAAYEPIHGMNLGIVAKIDMADIIVPFLYSGLISVGLVLALVTIGALAFMRITRPILRQIEESRERWQFAVEGSGIGIWDQDFLSGRMTHSPRYCEILGYDLEEFNDLGKDWSDFVHPDDIERVEDSHERHYRGEIPEVINEFHMRHKDGHYVWIMGRGRVMQRDEQGNPLRMVGTHIDITPMKEAEELLRQRRQELLDIQSMSKICSYTWDLETDVITWTPEYFNLIERDADSVLLTNEGFYELVHPEDRQRLQEWDRGTINSEAEPRIVFRMVMPDGRIKYVSGFANVILNKNGKPARVVGYNQDITDQVDAERALRQSEERYRSVVDVQSDVIFRFLPGGAITFVNDAFCRFFGGKAEDWVGTDVLYQPLTHPEDYGKIQQALGALSPENPVSYSENRNLRGDGEVRWFHWTNRALYNEENQLLEFQIAGRDITERREAEIALQLSEERYRSVVETQSELISRIKPGGTITFVNEAFCRFFGDSPGEWVGKSVYDQTLTHPDDLEMVRNAILSLTPQNPVSHTENRSIKKDGETRWFLWTNHAIFDEKGSVIEYQAAGRDITERREAEYALQLSEERYRDVVEMQTDLICRFLVDGTITFVNPAYSDFYGEPVEYWLGRNAFEHESVYPEDVEKVRYTFSRLTPETPLIVSENRNLDKEGNIFWYQWTNSAIFDENGKLVEYQSTGRDITGRKLAEEALAQSEARYRSIVEDMPLFLCRFMADGRVTFINRLYTEYFEQLPQEMEGKTFFDFIPFEEREAILEAIGSLDRENPVITHEHRMVLPGGDIRWNRWTIQAFFDDLSRLVEYQAIGQDTTEQRRMEKLILETEKLATLGTLAAGIAHEINSPLQVITGLTERHSRAMERNEFDREQLEHDLETLTRNAWRVANIVRSLLTYSRSSVERAEQTNLSTIIRDTLLLIEHQLRNWANIEVITDLAEDLPPITCDANNISQALINLLTNARDAMSVGGKITVRTGYDAARELFFLQVEDTGEGIPDEIKERIFDPFFTTKEIGRGTGLGLSIVRSIAQAHGGEISVESSLKDGTTITMWLAQEPPQRDMEIEEDPGRFND